MEQHLHIEKAVQEIVYCKPIRCNKRHVRLEVKLNVEDNYI
jgi:hypothetical protein